MTKKIVTIEDLLKDLDGLNGKPQVIDLLHRFIKDELFITDGLLLVKIQGPHVEVDATPLCEQELVWIGNKIAFESMNGGLTFD